MKSFEQEEAIIIYLSDHGLDIYYTADNYAAHAKTNDPVSMKYGTEIPFLIYTTPKYNDHFSETADIIKRSVDNPFSTDNLIYTLMDIIGVSTFNGMEINHYSLFIR